MSVLKVQQKLKEAGHYNGPLDGIWGPQTELALDAAMGRDQAKALAWGSKISEHARVKVFDIAREMGMQADHLMSAMAFESGESFNPAMKNGAGSGATGLIQFMPATAKEMGTTTAALAAMTVERQLDFVRAYFRPYKGRLKTLEDVYMAILWPAAIGQPDSYPLFDERTRPTHYRQNSGLDVNADRIVSKAEAAAKVRAKLLKGVKPPYVWRS